MGQEGPLFREEVIPSTVKDQERPIIKELVPTVAQVNDIFFNVLDEFNDVNASSDESITIIEEIEEITLDTSRPDGGAIDGGSPTPNESQEHAVVVQPEKMDVDSAPNETGTSFNEELLLQFEQLEQYEDELLACNESEDLDRDLFKL